MCMYVCLFLRSASALAVYHSVHIQKHVTHTVMLTHASTLCNYVLRHWGRNRRSRYRKKTVVRFVLLPGSEASLLVTRNVREAFKSSTERFTRQVVFTVQLLCRVFTQENLHIFTLFWGKTHEIENTNKKPPNFF